MRGFLPKVVKNPFSRFSGVPAAAACVRRGYCKRPSRMLKHAECIVKKAAGHIVSHAPLLLRC